MRRLYTPPVPAWARILGFQPSEPVLVDVIVLDYDSGMADIVAPVAEQSAINVMRKHNGQPPITTLNRRVPLECLTIPPTEH